MKVKLLAYTPNPLLVIYTAFRTCYSSQTPQEIWQKFIHQSEQSEQLLKEATKNFKTAFTLSKKRENNQEVSLNKDSQEKIAAFIKKYLKTKHESPLEHVSFVFAISGISRALSHQLVRHRIASYSQQSQRYVDKFNQKDPDKVFGYITPLSIQALGEEAIKEYRTQMEYLQTNYNNWRNRGVPAEDARFILPNAAETNIIVTMNARELLHIFKQRCCLRAQWEIRAMAEEMLRLVKEKVPDIFEKAGPACVNGPCPEKEMTCGKIKEVRKKFNQRTKEKTGKSYSGSGITLLPNGKTFIPVEPPKSL